jgi:hypothetical protein
MIDGIEELPENFNCTQVLMMDIHSHIMIGLEVWSLLLQAGSGGPAPISRAVVHAYYSKRPRGALTYR